MWSLPSRTGRRADRRVAAGPGVLTQMGQANSASNKWSGVADAFSRVATETNNTFQYPAYGHVNGQSIFLSAWLDNQPVSITGVGTNAMQWRAMMELAPGTHQLKVSALHPSGFYTAWTTNSFTNNIAYQATADSYDSAGNITTRVWKSPNGTVDRTQTLSWDARGRLHKVSERDSSNSGYDWTATYDGLNRRLSTATVSITNGVTLNLQPSNINQYYDPQVEFLELGVSYGLQTVWKLYGPDLNGRYGGLNGTGGFDAVSPYLNFFNPLISDFRGNVLAEITNGIVSWIPARPTGYGAVPGYRPVALTYGADMAQSSAWRGHWVDITGYHQIGLRPYDSISGRWLTYDSVWNQRDPNYYSFAGGEPIIGFDSDGRILIQQWQQAQQNMLAQGGVLNNLGAAGISAGYAAMQLFSIGSFAKNDVLADQNLAGQISDSQFWANASLNSGVALASVAVTGGSASLAVQGGMAALRVPAAFVAGGATIGVGGQAAVDVLVNQQFSGWNAYEYSAISGGIGGATAYLTGGNVYAGGAAGGFARTVLVQSQQMADDQRASFNYWLAGGETALGASPGLFGMNGFYSSVEKQILTKMENETIQNIAATTGENIFANQLMTGLPDIGVDVWKEAFGSSSEQGQQTFDLSGSSFNNSAYSPGALGGKR